MRSRQVILRKSDLPVGAIEGAVEELCRERTALSLVEANREIDKLLKQGVKVEFPDAEKGGQRVEVVRVEIEKMLDSGLPEKYTADLFETKCGALFQHVLEKYPENGESVDEVAG